MMDRDLYSETVDALLPAFTLGCAGFGLAVAAFDIKNWKIYRCEYRSCTKRRNSALVFVESVLSMFTYGLLGICGTYAFPVAVPAAIVAGVHSLVHTEKRDCDCKCNCKCKCCDDH